MSSFLYTLQSGAGQGLMWALLTLGVFITYRLLDFADLTVEGSFPLGAAVAAVCINASIPPFFAILLAVAAGMLAGMCTGLLNTVFKIPPILSGILTMIALYSINLRITSDKVTVPFSNPTVKTFLTDTLKLSAGQSSIVLGVFVCMIVVCGLYFFFGTEIGCAIRSTGHNPYMSRALGVNTNKMTVLCLMISNGIVALSGSLVSQMDLGSAILTMGQGSIVIGLASVIIGEVVFCRKDHSFAYKLSAIVMGAVIYRTIIALVLKYNSISAIMSSFGLAISSSSEFANSLINWTIKSTDLKLITAIVVSIALALPVLKANNAFRKLKKKNAKEAERGEANA